ncbi:phage portal protein [Pelagerythrobacter marensis]|uniref:Phage portal protein n=1 Tax=Pelagerythrobacter marensis TaxID=543877 RepID=A0ABZ2D8A2_9SPHN
MQLLGVLDRNNALPVVSIEAALQVPAVWSIVNFLPRTLAALPLHTFESGENGERVDDRSAQLLSFAPNEEETSFGWRCYHWHQVFTGGRGCNWIERVGGRPVAIWPMDPALTQVVRRDGRKIYRFDGREYPARDVIDTPFMLKRDRLGSYSPIVKCNKAISLAVAMGDFAGSFFNGGGVPPLALEGPLPSGADAFKRAQADIQRAIDTAKKAGLPFFGMPPGHKLNPIGFEPGKSQMVEARLFQVQELARVWQMPPVFVGDLSKGTFSNTEQQDLQLVKHLIGQWAKAFEDELTLKLYGWRNPRRRVKHNLDGLQRGAFKDRIEALARAILTGQMMPDEARALENRPPDPNGEGGRLYVQQATVPLGTMPGPGHNGGSPLDEEEEEEGADGNADTED